MLRCLMLCFLVFWFLMLWLVVFWLLVLRSLRLRSVRFGSIGLGCIGLGCVRSRSVRFGLRGIPYLLNHIHCSRTNLAVPSGILHLICRSFEIVVFKGIDGLLKTGEL